MRLTARSSLPAVAVAVGDVLRRAGIRAVLTGGACASLYTRGRYVSVDADFVLATPPSQSKLDVAMAGIGFRRERDRYVHEASRFYVEFPPGPLGIGEDFAIRPVWRTWRSARTLALSATDACRDRLAAFYHWNDLQSLATAVEIALRQRLNLARIRAWSLAERQMEGYQAFTRECGRRRARSKRRRPGTG